MNNLESALRAIVKEISGKDIEIKIERPLPKFGDFSTNVALQLAKEFGQNPTEIASKIVGLLKEQKLNWLGHAEVAGAGFINIFMDDDYWHEVVNEALTEKYGKNNSFANQTVLVEFLDPNPFKELHIGHAYVGAVGDAIASLFEVSGANVHRVTYQGDVGLHVAKAIYGIIREIGDDTSKLESVSLAERPRLLGRTYAAGAQAFETDASAKTEIYEINKKIYDRSDKTINKIREIGTNWSLVYFDEVYRAFAFTTFEKNYMESMVADEGVKIVKEHIDDGIFEKSDGAVIFRGEKYGLHTRVFINSQGLPTYEAKDLGNAMVKQRDYNYDKSIIITGYEQAEYFKVMLKALEQFDPKAAHATTHISNGFVTLSTGKMSSRTGDVVRALDLLESTESTAKSMANNEKTPTHEVALAAIKYAFLKNRLGSDIVYDVNESLSLEGNSGPYIQYAYARACNIIKKQTSSNSYDWQLDEWERSLIVKISQFPEIIKKSTQELMPHYICTYLFELSQVFNRFYENDRVIGSPKENQRLVLVSAYARILKNGLKVLNIPAPEKI